MTRAMSCDTLPLCVGGVGVGVGRWGPCVCVCVMGGLPVPIGTGPALIRIWQCNMLVPPAVTGRMPGAGIQSM